MNIIIIIESVRNHREKGDVPTAYVREKCLSAFELAFDYGNERAQHFGVEGVQVRLYLYYRVRIYTRLDSSMQHIDNIYYRICYVILVSIRKYHQRNKNILFHLNFYLLSLLFHNGIVNYNAML